MKTSRRRPWGENTSKLSLALLQCFMAIISERSVTRAAMRLRLSQSTVSSALAKLRSIYGDPLFVMGSKALEPTTRALELSGPLGNALREIEASLVRKSMIDPASATALFQIAMVDLVQDRMLPRLIGMLSREAPGVRLSITPLVIDSVEANLASQQIDLAIASTAFTLRRVRYSRLYDERFTCVLRSSHPASGRKWTPQSFASLHHLQVSPTGSDFVSILDRALSECGCTRDVRYYIPNYRLAARMVAASDLVALMPAWIAEDMAGICAIELKDPPVPLAPLPVIQMWHERSHADPLHRWLRQRIVALARLKSSA